MNIFLYLDENTWFHRLDRIIACPDDKAAANHHDDEKNHREVVPVEPAFHVHPRLPLLRRPGRSKTEQADRDQMETMSRRESPDETGRVRIPRPPVAQVRPCAATPYFPFGRYRPYHPYGRFHVPAPGQAAPQP